MTHTPGPWIVVNEIQMDDDAISTIPIFGPDGPGYGRVGTAYAEIGRDEELWPNALLQATAPELLAILRTLTDHASETYPHFESERGQREIADARKAIAKAEETR